jgi:NAD(P)-dependent dehydrogenase (short-subunit alcohol dehydrogenase family)
MTPVEQTIALISGANTGIGLAVATQLAKDHVYHVIIGSRKAAAGEEVAAALVADGFSASSVQLDLSSDESIAAAVSWIEREFGVLDLLINNAGILLDSVPRFLEANKGLSTRELFNQTLSTNVTGTACLTEACLPLLRKSESPRLIFVSSRLGSLTEATNKSTLYYSIDYKAYDSSKAALNMLALNYARILEENGAMVNTACPGLVKTKLTNEHPMGTSTELGAQRIVELATAAKGGPTATFSDRNGGIPW